MTDVIITFDTEDFTCCRAADGILEAANILKEEGIRGCFNLVGLLAKQLVAWGREDVLDALKYHEISFHSYGHSLHPCINEYTNREDFTAAYNEVIRQESLGISYVRAATGAQQLSAAVPPGCNENYVAMYAYADLGIPIYAGELLDTPRGEGAFFCNQLYLFYCTCFEKIVQDNLANDQDFIDQLAARKTAVIYNHPNRWLYKDWWDSVNFRKGINHYPWGEWGEAERMTDEEREIFRSRVRTFIRNLKKDGRFRFRTYSEIAKERCGGVRMLKKEDMPALYQRLKEHFYPQKTPVSLCISDIFAAATAFLKGEKFFTAGRVYGFLDTPCAISAPVTVQAEDVIATARKTDCSFFLPASFQVGKEKLGPADFLFAMLATLSGEREITLTPREQNIDLSDFHRVNNFCYGKWQFADDFEGEWLKKRTPLQGWTIRY